MLARILVVDDNEDYLAVTKVLLELAGYETSVASTFEDGKRELRDRAPDLLILDVRLGAFNGLQLISTRQVRIPAIIVTGFDDPVLRADAAAFGASYMVKPVPPAALLALIEEKLALVASAGAERVEPHGLATSDTSGGVAPAVQPGEVPDAGEPA
jgi:DNA-binding response OmpR family regulator